MIIPGVQKPHWRPCWSQNACWSGWSVAPLAIPSIVVISWPSAWTASIVQHFALAPSTWTVQAPQLLVSQPTWVPVSPKSSRSRWTSSRRGSTSASRRLAVDGDGDVLVSSSAPLTRRPARARARVRSERTVISADHRPLVVDGPAAVRGGAARRGGRGAGRAERRVGRAACADEARLRGGRGERRARRRPSRRCRPQSIAAVGAEMERGRDAGRGEVAGLPLELLVGAASCRAAARDADLGEDLGRLDARS